jgi:hypothetical protein
LSGAEPTAKPAPKRKARAAAKPAAKRKAPAAAAAADSSDDDELSQSRRSADAAPAPAPAAAAEPSAASPSPAAALPPGWSREDRVAQPSGKKYSVFHGPAGERFNSAAKAWRKHRWIPAAASSWEPRADSSDDEQDEPTQEG